MSILTKNDRILDRAAKKHMISWNLTGFKRKFPRLYRTIMAAMDNSKDKIDNKLIKELAHEHINKCKDMVYSSKGFAGRNSGNELEGDYGSWRDWEARLILFGRELMKNQNKDA